MTATILIVEGDPGEVKVAVACLEARGFKVKTASGAALSEAERRHEAMRQEREELEYFARKVIEVAPGAIGIYCMSPDGRVTMPYMTPKMREITGFDPDAMARDATAAYRAIHPDDCAGHIASIQESARTLMPWQNEFRVHHPEKGEIWLEGRSIPERQADGSIVWYGFLHDVTARKRAEEMLRISKNKFKTLTENVPDVIIRYDREGQRIYANPVFASLTGLQVEGSAGLHSKVRWGGSIPKDEYRGLVKKVMDTGQPAEGFMDWQYPDGRIAHHFYRVVPERNQKGEVIGALAIGRDITALKEAERRLQESREQLRQLAAYRDTVREEERKYIARELHDELGQFLSALRMQASMLRMRFGTDNPALIDHVNGMIQLVDDNIQVVRNISTALRPAMLDLGIVAALEWLAQEFEEYSGVPCDLRVMKQADDMEEHCATTLFRVVQESLNNVMRHAGAKRVAIQLVRTGAHYRLKVSDDGKGFDPDTVSKKSLGLVGMRERVLMLGGDIRIASEPGSGTALEVDIPVRQAAKEQ